MTDLRKILQDLGPIDVDIEEGDIVTDLVVIARVQRLDDTDDSLILSGTENTGGIVFHGMLTTAVLQHTQWLKSEFFLGPEEDDQK